MVFFEDDKHRKTGGPERKGSKSSRAPETVDARIARLERRTDRLELACQALWELLRDQSHIPEETVFEKMHEIDLRDGRADGKMSPRARECRGCKRPVKWERRHCIYCDHPVENPAIVE